MVPPRIDQEFLDRGNDLVLNLFQYVSNFLRPPQWRPINVIEERRIFSQLPIGLRSLYLICRLQLDISSGGGFDALLKNGYFLMTHEIMESFKLIKAIRHGDVFLKFTSAY